MSIRRSLLAPRRSNRVTRERPAREARPLRRASPDRAAGSRDRRAAHEGRQERVGKVVVLHAAHLALPQARSPEARAALAGRAAGPLRDARIIARKATARR